MSQYSFIRILLVILCVSSGLLASYQSSAKKDLEDKEKISERSHKTRVRASNLTKLTKIYFIDTKELSHTNKLKKHLISE